MQALVRYVAKRSPWRDPRDEERLGLPHVPDARDEPLVENRLSEPAALIGTSKTLDHSVEVGRGRHDVGPEPRGLTAPERQLGPAPLNGLPLSAS